MLCRGKRCYVGEKDALWGKKVLCMGKDALYGAVGVGSGGGLGKIER